MARFFLTAFVLIFLTQTASAAPNQPASDCDQAGPLTSFCSGESFARVDAGETRGISHWLHANGYLCKVVVQRVPVDLPQARIESQIISMVSAQADTGGRRFMFSDLESGAAGSGAFGTLSYSLAGTGQNKAILHSYVSIKGVVVQVISQLAIKRARRTAQDLQIAHDAALDALQIVALDPDA